MAASSKDPQLTKCEKSGFNAVKKEIFQACQRLGIGTSSPVPYDTAWVARVPKAEEQSPAFPDSLQWLRDHQTKDGGWEVEYPPSVHSKILNTFVAVLALSQWNYPEDEERIKRGVQALELLAKTMPSTETDDHVFELLISSLLDDARELKLNITYKHFEFHSKIGKQKLKDIEGGILSNQQNSSWALLESAGGLELEIEFYRQEIIRNGLIAAQPSTTAFILRYARLQGEDFVEAEWALEKLCAENHGGVPRFSLSDNFEIVYGLDVLLKADINPRINKKNAAVQKSIDDLKERFDFSNGIGFSSNWPVADGECSVTAFRVLKQVLKETSDLKSAVVTANAPCPTRKDYQSNKRNISSYYNILQQAFEIKKDMSEEPYKISDFIAGTQNNDGGWGGQSNSSVEETAYVCLAVYRLIQSRCDVVDKINLQKLVEFMDSVVSSQSHESFWYYKVNFSSNALSELVIACAKYVVFRIRKLCAFAEALEYFRPDFLEIKYSDENNQPFYEALLPIVVPGEEIQNIDVDRKEITDYCKSVFGPEHYNAHMQNLVDVSLNCSYYWKNFKTPFEIRAIDTLFLIGVFLLDEFFDNFLKGKKLIEDARQAPKIATAVLRGDHNDLRTLPDFNCWSLQRFWKWCDFARKKAEEKNWNLKPFITLAEKMGLYKIFLQAYIIESYYGVVPTSKQYLRIHKHDSGTVDCLQYFLMTDGYPVDSTEFENDELFVKFRDCSAKATRVMLDIFSVHKDLSQSNPDNYCVCLMKEYQITVEEALRKATLKGNKEITKMYYLKKLILENPKNKGNKSLALTLEYTERNVHCGMFWSSSTDRYKAGPWTVSTKEVHPERTDTQFAWKLCFD